MTLTLERMGNGSYGGLAALGDDSGPDDLTSVLASLPTPGGPSALGTSVTCTGSNEQLLNNVCYDFTPLTSPGSGPGTASPNAATLAAGSYYTTGGNVVTPGTGNNGIPAGSYQVFNPNTGAVIGTTTSAPVQTAAPTGQLIPGISNSTLAIGAAVFAVFLIAMSQR